MLYQNATETADVSLGVAKKSNAYNVVNAQQIYQSAYNPAEKFDLLPRPVRTIGEVDRTSEQVSLIDEQINTLSARSLDKNINNESTLRLFIPSTKVNKLLATFFESNLNYVSGEEKQNQSMSVSHTTDSFSLLLSWRSTLKAVYFKVADPDEPEIFLNDNRADELLHLLERSYENLDNL